MGIGPAVTSWEEWSEVFNDKEAWRALISEILTIEKIKCRHIVSGYPGTNKIALNKGL